MIVFIIPLISIGLFFSKKLDRNYFSPIGFFSILWGISLLMYEFSPKPYPTLNLNTQLLIFGAWFLFSLGYVFFRFASQTRINKQISSNRPNVFIKIYSSVKGRLILHILILLSFVGAIAFINKIINHLSNPLALIYASQEIRQTIVGGDFSAGALLNTYTAALIYSTSIITGAIACWYHKKIILYIPIIAAILFDLGNAGRITTITTIFLWGISYILSWKYSFPNQRIQIPAFVKYFISILSSALILLITFSRSEGRMTMFESLYSYFTGSWIVLDQYINNLNLSTHFASTLYPIIYTLYKLGLWFENPAQYLGSTYYVLSPFGSNLNTFTILTPFYNDFGFIITFALFFIFGFWASKIYKGYFISQKSQLLIPLVWIYYVILISLHGWPFVSIGTTVSLIISYLFIVVLPKKIKFN
ncbi:oligosaccharide repeat unit polymerase [Mariniphaga sediminis]|uniref:Oligosaccharide repeat unit polymerase n=1 Tax=Mariniphaga sediminis TaxID=1628158 RepID=A0A399CXX1_9BACT|nr:O-antigen polymerase [Mariniphaga sediminis]RIH63241.1 oligosaccharide repeat unit polymerase [Mariniphaga sediminis]